MSTDDDDLQHAVAPSLNDHLAIVGLIGDELASMPADGGHVTSGNVTSSSADASIIAASSLISESQQDLNTPPHLVVETETPAFAVSPINVEPLSSSGMRV
jgi:hypothetical protein